MKTAFRINPLWWPALVVASPFAAPVLLAKNRRYRKNIARADEVNRERLRVATALELPELDFLELTVLVEWETEEGFSRDAGVSFLLRSDRGSLLFDIGFGAERPAFTRNAAALGIDFEDVDALAISHLHPDHTGGASAWRAGRLGWPEESGAPGGKPCFVPDKWEADGFKVEVVTEPRLLAGGIASTGPLARSLFVMGWTEEQALVARVKGKGLVLITGCGHMTAELALEMAGRLCDAPLYALCGGLHFPITRGRGSYAGIQLQTILGTGKPPWRRVTDKDLSSTIAAINAAGPKKLYLSAHDTCDHAIARMKDEINAETEVLKAGATYRF